VTVEVQLFATLSRYLPPGSEHGTAMVEIPEGATVEDLVRVLGIPDAMATVALVNGREAVSGAPLTPADVVTLFPPLAGGAERPRRPRR
jgi:molybdopterin converting factor small subunit